MANISIFGGTGYLGYHVAAALAKEGHDIKIFTRRLIIHSDLQTLTNITFVRLPEDDIALKNALIGEDILINLIGCLETRAKRLYKAHVDLPLKFYETAHEAGVTHMVHFSALGAEEHAKSKYFKSKYEAERLLTNRAAELAIRLSIIKPSMIFGHHNLFFRRMITWARVCPVIFLPCGDAEFQPVYVENVVAAIQKVIVHQDKCVETYELAGPKRYMLKELVVLAAESANVNVGYIGKLPDILSSLLGRLIGWLPKAPFTHDWYLSMQHPNVSDRNDLAHLGITPTALESVLAFEYRTGLYDRFHQDRINASRQNSDLCS